MRASKVIEGLPIYTPALLDIANVTDDQVAERVVYKKLGADSLEPLTDHEQLNCLWRADGRIRVFATSEPEHSLRPALEDSLGALVRITRSASELGLREKYMLGSDVRAMARLAVGYGTRFGMGYEQPFERVHTHQILGHIARHADSYTTLLPLMDLSQRNHYRRELRAAIPIVAQLS